MSNRCFEEDKRMTYIYMILNKEDGIAYVGQTEHPEERIETHLSGGSNIPELNLDIEWYGRESFEAKILDVCFYRHRSPVESWWTKKVGEKYALYNKHLGFNFNGEGTPSFKKRMSEVTRGKNNGMYGKKGSKAVNGNKVVAMDDNGNIIHSFATIGLALEFCNTKGHNQLYEAMRKGTKYKGFFWKCNRKLC